MSVRRPFLFLVLMAVLPAVVAQAGVLTTLHVFNVTDGQYPQAVLAAGEDGSFYGSTSYGGVSGQGSVFKVTTNGVFFSVASFGFTNGANPYGRLLRSGDVFFGTTANGGPFNHGTVFQLVSNQLAVQVSFTNTAVDGSTPFTGLIADTNGSFYGTTVSGGPGGYGTVFRMGDTETRPTTLVAFDGVNGGTPEAALLAHTNGWFYGTTLAGGSNNLGTVFKMSPTGVFTNIFAFASTNGANPWASLARATDGALYGTTANGGPGNYGTIYRVTTNDSVEMVAAFGYTNGANPIAGLTPATDGSLYGVARYGGANSYGTIYKVATNGAIETMFSFNYGNGSQPYAGMVFGPDGHLYGTTLDGGSGAGTVFRFILNPPAPAMQPVVKTNADAILTWSAVAGGRYQLQCNPNLAQTNWLNLGFPITATNNVVVASDPAPLDAQRYYRAVLLQP